jgi:hypothetical protein
MQQPNFLARPYWLLFAAVSCALLLMAALVGGQAQAGAAIQATPISSDIVADTTWSSTGSPYLVTVPIRVVPGATLTIEAGVQVTFATGAGLRIEGGLNAQGTQSHQVRMAGVDGASWQGLLAAQPAGNLTLQSVTVEHALVGLTIRQQNISLPTKSARVDVRDSLFANNGIGIDADYALLNNAPRLSLRNSLLTGNQIGLQLNGLPGGNIKPKLSHNSFVGNGIGVNAINMTGNGVKLQQQWWASADGPLVNSAACGSSPAPGSSPRDLVCGTVDFVPWSKVPAGRALVPAGQSVVIESAIGPGALGDDDMAATSVLTLTVPSGAFTETVDLLATASDIPSTPPGQATQLAFEVTAVAGGQAIHRFANSQQLTLEIRYTSADLNGADPRKLLLYYLDENTGAWSFAGIRTAVDPANQRLTASLDHLTRMRVTSVDLKSTRLPLVLHR